MSSYYTDLDEDLGWDEIVAEDMREREFYERRKQQSEDARIRQEVKKQLKAHGITQPVKSRVFKNGKEIANKTSVRGAKVEVSCKCCRSKFLARVADVNRGWGKFCSKSCKARGEL